MRILLTNDDGYHAPGMAVLEAIARQLSDDIWVCAPAEEQSGAGHSLTLSRPVRIRQHEERRWSCSGTPTDSVMMAIGKLMPEKPDLILSGVNRGANLGDDITYSGTVSAAIEGALAGIPAIALSQVYAKEGMGDSVPFEAAEVWGAKVLRPLLDMEMAPRTLININFPAIPAAEVRGIRVTRQGFHDYGRGSIVEGTDPRGYRYYWFGLHGIEHSLAHDSDLEAIDDNYISVTPLQLDLTHDASLAALRGAYGGKRSARGFGTRAAMSKRPNPKLHIQSGFHLLKRASKWPIWADVITRLSVAFFLIAIVVLVHWIDRAGLKDSHDGHISFLDVVYFTMISVTTTGFGDIAPVSDRSRLIEAVIVTPIRIMVLFIFVGTAYNFVLKRTWEKWRMARIQAKLTNHIVVLGYGISGSEAVKELIARGTDPSCIVVIDQARNRINAAEAAGCNVLEGDASNDDTLVDVRIAEAQSVLVSAGRDDTSILMVLTVRHLAPHVPISVVIRAKDNELLARQAGASNVINPVSFTGLLLAGSAQGAHVADYMADLAAVGGKVQLRERPVSGEEIGSSLDRLASGGRGLRIYRGGKPYGFWEAETNKLEPGDMIVEVIQCEACEAD